MIERVDTNGNGTIEFEEVLDALGYESTAGMQMETSPSAVEKPTSGEPEKKRRRIDSEREIDGSTKQISGTLLFWAYGRHLLTEALQILKKPPHIALKVHALCFYGGRMNAYSQSRTIGRDEKITIGLTISELQTAIRTLQGRNPTEAQLRYLVKEVNVGGDGTVGLPGFLAIMQCGTCHDVSEEEMRVSPEAYNEDGDGYSTDSETEPRRQPSGVHMAL